MKPFLDTDTNANLSITSPLQGVVWSLTPSNPSPSYHIIRDSEDFSLLFRLVFYATKLSTTDKGLINTGGDNFHALRTHYPIALQLINEKVTMDDANTIWLGSTDEVLQAAVDVLSEGAQILRIMQSDEDFIRMWVSQGLELNLANRETYLKSLAFLSVMGNIIDQAPKTILQDFEAQILASHKSENLLQSATLLNAAGESLTMSPNGAGVTSAGADLEQSDIAYRWARFSEDNYRSSEVAEIERLRLYIDRRQEEIAQNQRECHGAIERSDLIFHAFLSPDNF